MLYTTSLQKNKTVGLREPYASPTRARKEMADMFKLKPGISKISRGCVFHNNEAFVYSIDAYIKSDLHLHEQVGMSLIQSRTANAITIDRDRTKSCFAVGDCFARDRQTETAT